MSPDPETQLQHSWLANADAWTDAVREGRIASRRLATDRAILEALLARHPRCVLDVGCGEGWLARALAAQGVAVVGIDASPPLIEAARALGGGDFQTLSYAEIIDDPTAVTGPFDAAVCNFALLGEDIVPLLHALRERLARDGRLYVQSLHPFTATGDEGYVDGWRVETFAAFGGAYAEPMPWYYRTMGSWLRTLGDARLVVERCIEPLHPDSRVPMSLLLVCRAHRTNAGWTDA